MEALRSILIQNNILLHKEIEEQESEYLNVKVRKKNNFFLIDKNQPLVVKIDCKFNLVGDNYVMSKFHYDYFEELIKLEQGSITFIK